jgi:DNA (cytosine-5)-methyltransferase 1
MASISRPTAISVFSGGGGLDLGFERAGYRTLAAIEVEKWACATLRANQGAPLGAGGGRRYLADAEILERDVRGVSGAELMRLAGLAPGELDLLCGGPPCVTFSVAGRREGLATETGRLFEAYARLLRVLRPHAFVFENVKGLLSAADGKGTPGGAWAAVKSRLQGAGYRIAWTTLDAADYGVPQKRERVIVVGLRGATGAPFAFPKPTHHDPSRPRPLPDLTPPWRTVRDAISDLPSPPLERELAPLPNHVGRRHSPATRASFAATPPGRRNDRFKRDRLEWDRPAKVVRAQGKLKSNGSGQRNSSHQALHPDEPRQITVRECARLQTFPDWYVLPPHFANGYRVVGDAVPPLLAEALGRSLTAQVQLPAMAAA